MKNKKMRRVSFNSESGIILPIVIILMLALTITGLAFLNAGVMENSLVRREIHKNQAFYLAEAGVEDARVQLGQNWDDLISIDTTPSLSEVGTYHADIYNTVYNTDSGEFESLPSNKRRVRSTGTVSEISKTVEVILRKPPITSSGINSALTAGGDIVIKGASVYIDPPLKDDDKNYPFDTGEDPGDGLSLFEEIFGVTQEEMKEIAQSSPNRYYDSAIKNEVVENITWVDGTLGESEITTDTWKHSGIWIVDGDLKITGGTFDGILWVIGKLTLGAGNPVISGAVFVECGAEVDTTLAGNVTVELNNEAIDDVLGNLGTGPIVEFWREL